MTANADTFLSLLEADAARRAARADHGERPAEPDEAPGLADLRFRLVNAFPRETRPVFEALRRTLLPFGYHLSPLHPSPDLSRPRMQTELTRAEGTQFAPLVFEMDRRTGLVRVFVRQFGGRAVPDFAERTLDLAVIPSPADMRAMLQDYVACMLRPLQDRAAA